MIDTLKKTGVAAIPMSRDCPVVRSRSRPAPPYAGVDALSLGGSITAGRLAATFDATAVVAGLQRAKGFDPDALTVTLLPLAAAVPGVGAAEVKARGEAVAKKAQVTYKRVTVRVTPAEK